MSSSKTSKDVSLHWEGLARNITSLKISCEDTGWLKMTGCQRVCKTLVSCIEGRASLIQDQEMSSSPSGIHLRKQWAYVLNISKFTSLTAGIFCIFILGEYEGPVRHVGIEVVGGVHGMVLDTPSEDDRGQRVRQLIPEQTFYNFDIGLCFWQLVLYPYQRFSQVRLTISRLEFCIRRQNYNMGNNG